MRRISYAEKSKYGSTSWYLLVAMGSYIALMKKFLIVFFLSFFTFLAHAQNFIHFPDSAYWRVDWAYNDPFICNVTYYYSYYWGGDTIIGSNNYKKLMSSGWTFTGDIICENPPNPMIGYVGAIREDTVANKVFFQPTWGSPTDTLLYDYNLNVGDTIKGYLPSFNNITVDSIDSVLIGTTYHRRWILDNQEEGAIIEGIGSTYGLIEYIGVQLLGGYLSALICISDSSGVLATCNFMAPSQTSMFWSFTSNMPCQLIIGTKINEYSIAQEKLHIYPNPTRGKFRVEGLEFGVEEIEIYDLFGRLVLRLPTGQAGSKEAQIDMSSYPAGLYIYRIGAARGKLVIE